MARPLSYTPTPVPHDPAAAEVDDLVRALHESGLLRALAGAVRATPDLAERLVQALDPDAVRALAELGTALSLPDPEVARRVAGGLRAGVEAAGRAGAAEPPGWFELARSAGSADVRRTLGTALATLAAFGRAMRP